MPDFLSASAIQRGEVQRTLKRIILAKFSTTGIQGNPFTARVVLRNLAKSVGVGIQVGWVDADNNLKPTYPTTPGTLQITPITRGDGNDSPLYGNPIFSSPGFSGPLTIPNGWEFNSMVPSCAIDVAIDPNEWGNSATGQIGLDINLEYCGAWWDPETVMNLLNRVTCEPDFNQPYNFNSGA